MLIYMISKLVDLSSRVYKCGATADLASAVRSQEELMQDQPGQSFHLCLLLLLLQLIIFACLSLFLCIYPTSSKLQFAFSWHHILELLGDIHH